MEHLPGESATSTAIRNSVDADELAERRSDPTRAPWSSTDYLLASIIDELRMGNWLFASANSKSRQPMPKFVERPGMKSRSGKRSMTIQEMKEIDPRLRDLDDETAMQRYREMTGRG